MHSFELIASVASSRWIVLCFRAEIRQSANSAVEQFMLLIYFCVTSEIECHLIQG